MKEPIRELAEKAGMTEDKFGMYFAKYSHDEDGVDLEKFAELIVQECIDKISENFVGAVGTHASEHNSAVLKCQTIIKEHFGVEA